jgi:CHASE2 domain-containing sensor protein
MKLDGRLRELWRKGPWYWLRVVILIVGGVAVGEWIGHQDFSVDLRYRIYRHLHRLTPTSAYVRSTVLILIRDDEYWKGELARRVPIKRDYLARLVRALDAADAAVIALDFDLRASVDGTLLEHPDYARETHDLLTTIRDVATRRPVVLPRTVAMDSDGFYVSAHDIYTGFDFGTAADRVLAGYIILPYDLRQVPVRWQLRDGTSADSFAQAIVRAFNPRALEGLDHNHELPYGSYLHPDLFPALTASAVLDGDPAATRNAVAHQIAIVGGAWSRFAYGGTVGVDTYESPMGKLPGAFIHANYVEALLDRRIYRPLPEGLVLGLEIAAALAGAVVLALEIAAIRKFGAVVILSIGLMVVSYVALQNLGRFFDFFVPLVLLCAHAALDKIFEWRMVARRCAIQHRQP